MKHLFLLTNTMTRLTADAIIKKEKLDGNDCVFLYTPLWKDPEPLKIAFIKTAVLPPLDPLTNNISDTENRENREQYQKKVDVCIETLVMTDEFEMYLPTLLDANANLLVSHPNCTKYHIIEGEYGGDNSFGFNPADNINWVRGRQLRLLELPRYAYITDIPFHTDDAKFGSMYAASEDTFAKGINVKLVNISSKDRVIFVENSNYAVLLLTDSFYVNKKISVRILTTFLDYLFVQHFLEQGIEHLICVWDNAAETNYAAPIQTILDRYGKDIAVSKTKEALFLSQLEQFKDIPLFFLDSEVGFLAARHGCKVYSTASILSALHLPARAEFALSNHRKKRAALNIPELGTERLELWNLNVLTSEIADCKRQITDFIRKYGGGTGTAERRTLKQRVKRLLKRILPASVIQWLKRK